MVYPYGITINTPDDYSQPDVIVRHRLGSSESALKGVIGEFIVTDYLRCNRFDIESISWAKISSSGPIVSLKSLFRGGSVQTPYDITAVKGGKRYLIEVKYGRHARLERNQLENLRSLAGTVNADGTVNVSVVARIHGPSEKDGDLWQIEWQELSPASPISGRRSLSEA